MSENLRKELVIQTFLNAQARSSFPKGMISHSDRGCQYTSNEFMNTLTSYGIKQSFSRVGMPGNNAWTESVFATLKQGLNQHFATREEARQTVFEGFYNTSRVQARLGY